jgi:pyrroline-5-carboxylate reductase
MIRLEIVGGGRMGEALLGGLLAAGWAEPGELAVVERLAERREQLAELFPGVAILAEPVTAEGAVIAVKPNDVADTCRTLAGFGVQRVLSIAAGVTTAALTEALGEGIAVVRAMPNTPALVRTGASAIAAGASATTADLDWAASILEEVGVVVRVEEADLDIVTGLSGSGPAYVFLMVENLILAGVAGGLTHEMAELLATQTLLGAATLLHSSDDDAAALREAVTSPGGTTAAGLRVLGEAGVPAAIVDAVLTAAERSRELGRS